MKKTTQLLLLLIFGMLSACSNEAPIDKETRLLNQLNTLETAIEEKRLDDFMEYINDDFKSSARGWNKKDIERLLRIRLMRNKTIHVHKVIRRVDWLNEGEQQAEVEVVAAMAGTDFSLTDLPTLNGDMVKFIVTFQLIDGEYLITQTEYNRASPGDFVF